MKTARLLIPFTALLAAAACGAPDPTSPLAPNASARRDGTTMDAPSTVGKGPGGMGSGYEGRARGPEPAIGTGGSVLTPATGGATLDEGLPGSGILTDGPGGMGSGY